MSSELGRFFSSISFKDINNDFINTSVQKVILKKQDESFEVFLENDTVINYNAVNSLFSCAKNGINGDKKCTVKMIYKNIKEEDINCYVKILINQLVEKRPSLVSLLDSVISIDDEIITIETTSKNEEELIKRESKNIINKLSLYGFNGYEINTFINLEKKEHIIKKINEDKTSFNPSSASEEITSNIIIGKHIDGEITSISNIMGDVKNVIIESYIFGKENMERETINIITLKISDNTNSILAKIFKKDKNEYKAVDKKIKVNKWYRFVGNVEFDKFSRELVLAIRHVEEIESKDAKIIDDREEKRVELHAHTMMSAMDSVVGLDLSKHTIDLVDHAIKLGHKAVAITDHNVCQAFPIAYSTIKSYNKGKEDKDKFKGIFGTELNVVNDDVDVIFNINENDYNLINEEYVVFDTETTGFYVGSDQMIEIGAVKIKNGEITDRFDELINPNRPLPKVITELTCITDDMLKDKDNEENVTKRFLEWAKDLPMVAHNAKFDIGFISSACSKYSLGEFKNTVLDTMSMARMINPEWHNHKLSTLVRKYKVDWDESAHHRADYDAEGTAKCFFRMCQILNDRNIETVKDILKQFDTNDLVKFSFPFHMSVLAVSRKGLKNLFKVVSAANTKYLYKNSQPKLPRKELLNNHDGLLFGSGCVNGEIFEAAKTKDDEELSNMMRFYDYIEVQPISTMTHLLQMESSGFHTEHDLKEHIKKIIRVAKMAGKLVVATGDVHNLKSEDKIYREIIVHQKANGRLHPLNRPGVTVPDMKFMTTGEMLDAFNFLDEELAYEIVVTNTNKIADMIEHFEVILDTHGIPFSPVIDDSVNIVTKMVYDKANELYGNPLPFLIEERIAKELYGDCVYNSVKSKYSDNSNEEQIFKEVNETIKKGIDSVKKLVKEYLTKLNPQDDDKTIEDKLKKELGGIIGGGFDVIYLISQKLVKKSNDDGFLVGSRGSVGSSFVANMMGITEVNSLSAHYRCPKCKKSLFNDEENKPLGATYSSGFDLPDKKCPLCNELMIKDGQDIPFATFLGFNADKVPDIDLNFSDLNQADTHEYTKELFGIDNVYRAGTIGTVAEKTAFGFVKGYCEDSNIMLRNLEIERLAKGCTGVKRTTGQHPGGIVVIPGYMDVYDFTPFQYPAEDPNSPWRTTHFDYHAIDENVLKLDILGHTDPTQLRMLQDLTNIDVTTVPLDDKETMSLFTSTKALGVTKDQIMNETGTLGVPEFGTPFTIQLVLDTKPKTFAELIKISGLSHGEDVWLGNAQDLIKNKVVEFSEVIGCRDDIMVYLMYNGIPALRAFKIMEFVRKGRASKEPEAWQEFAKELREAKIDEWYIKSCEKIKYMFPKAHAAAYVISAFRIAYFKVHYPAEYYASYFSTRFDDFDLDAMIGGYDAIKAKMGEIIAKGYEATNKESSVLETLKIALEATARGFKFTTLDIQKSDGKNFTIDEFDKTLLIPPFRALDGLGESVASKIIEERKIKLFYSIEDFQTRGKVNQTTLEKLRILGVFEGMPESSQLSLF